jgi:hypothetical protein
MLAPSSPELVKELGFALMTGRAGLQMLLATAELTGCRGAPATEGTVVRGFIGVDTFNNYPVAGDELVNIPCTYTVG